MPSNAEPLNRPRFFLMIKKRLSRFVLGVTVSAMTLTVYLSTASSLPDSKVEDYSARCVTCHADIAAVQLESDHAHTMLRVEAIPSLIQSLPLEYEDQISGIRYRIEAQSGPSSRVDLVAQKGQQRETLRLIWAVGAGRKGITFVGKTSRGDYGQSRVSWYQKTGQLSVTTGLEKRPVNAYDALAGWMNPHESEHCLSCHMTRNAEVPPDSIREADAGVHCERCHGSGEQHILAMAQNSKNPSHGIDNPGRLGALEQIYFCGACHGIPPGGADLRALGHAMAMNHSVRFPAKRLVLSRCYNESGGRLKCTTCHNPHENLASSFDQNCLSCHGAEAKFASHCPQADNDCVRCHMPEEAGFMTHSEFADHWIRVVSTSN